jgi:DNA-binding GntR family transcriptional regulator
MPSFKVVNHQVTSERGMQARSPSDAVARRQKVEIAVAAGDRPLPAKGGEDPRIDPESSLRQAVYDGLRYRLITGKIAPGVSISTRGLADQLGVSQMPVRDALARLATEGAVAIRSKRRIIVPVMTRARIEEIVKCRLLLEPAAAEEALMHIDADLLAKIRDADRRTDLALSNGDVADYMESNFRFHTLIYRASGMPTLNHMIETLWMQFGPFMRVVYGRVGTANLIDQHTAATQAIAARDREALRRAIASDISDGMALIIETERRAEALAAASA